MIGTTLSHYRILEKLGQGGMGVVYRAEDTTLGRQVAIKVLPDIFAGDPERLARYEREARLLASLSHQNIATIHGLEEAGGKRFIVMELAEGETLAKRISRGPLPVDEALEVCHQIAEGLEAAHEKGIIHRDLKPGNVMVSKEGKVKILDFGLAKAFHEEPTASDLANSPTITEAMTHPGVVLGTAAYMSPEQAKGRPVDKRADIWAFGCILFECLTRARAFEGETITETLAAILKGEPNWNILPPNTPGTIRTLLRRCLKKDAKSRLHAIADVRIEIEEGLTNPASENSNLSSRGAWRMTAIWLVVLLAVGITSSLLTWRLKTLPASLVHRVSVMLPAGVQLTRGSAGPIRTELAVSPDGRIIVFSAGGDGSESKARLYRRALDSTESVPIEGTEGARMPFFSPDGQWVGFYAQQRIQKIPLTGGIPIVLCELAALPPGASWGPQGRIIIGGNRAGLQGVSDSGGKLEDMTTLDPTAEASHRLPSFLPGGDTVLFTAMPHRLGIHGQIEVLSLKTGMRKVLLEDGTDARYVPTGHVVYIRQGTLFAVAFDPDRLEPLGSSVPVLQGVKHAMNSTSAASNSGAGQFSFSGSGTLVYSTGGIFPDADLELLWVNRKGEAAPVESVGRRPFLFPRISPDGHRLAYEATGREWSIWVHDLVRSTSIKLTGEGIPGGPIWSHDSSRIAFEASRAGVRNLFWMSSDGSDTKERLTSSKLEQYPAFFTLDGRSLCFVEEGDIWLLQLDSREVVPLIHTESSELWPECSPDSKWLAYGSNESGHYEIYVTALENPKQKIPVSVDGGREPLWAPNGREIFYWTLDSKKLMAVDVVLHPSFRAGRPRELFSLPYYGSYSPKRGYDMHPDGQRFVIPRSSTIHADPVIELNLVLNWFEELKRLVPAGK